MFIATKFLLLGGQEDLAKALQEKQRGENTCSSVKSIPHHQVQQAWEWSATIDPPTRQGLRWQKAGQVGLHLHIRKEREKHMYVPQSACYPERAPTPEGLQQIWRPETNTATFSLPWKLGYVNSIATCKPGVITSSSLDSWRLRHRLQVPVSLSGTICSYHEAFSVYLTVGSSTV